MKVATAFWASAIAVRLVFAGCRVDEPIELVASRLQKE